MKEGKKINSLWITVLLSLVIVVFTAGMLRITAHAAGPFNATYEDVPFYFCRGNFSFSCGSNDDGYRSLSFEFSDPDSTYTLLYKSGSSYSYAVYSTNPDCIMTRTEYRDEYEPDVVSSTFSYSGYTMSSLEYVPNSSFVAYGDYGLSAKEYRNLFKEFVDAGYADDYKELPDLSKYTLNEEYRLSDFNANNSINASWSGSTAGKCGYTDLYNVVEFIYQPRSNYDYVSLPITVTYKDTFDISSNGFYIPWIDVQIDNTDYYLSCMKVTPIGQDSSGLLYKGKSSIALYDAFGSFLGATTPTTVDTESFTDNIAGAVYDSSIPTLSNLTRTNNGFADVMSSYSQSVTFRWSDYFEDSSYYIQVRTTFRYKLATDSIWEEVTIDTSVPMGRYSCLVDEQVFTYTYGDYANMYWQQDDSIWTADDLDRQGNIQPIKDSIRIVKFTEGAATCGAWTTFTLKNGVWETGQVTGSYVSENLDNDNNSSSLPDDEANSGNFLVDFDFTNLSGAWDAFTGMFRNLISFLGEFPDLFAEVFSFLPYEIRNMIYISMISICVIGLCKAVIH